MNRKISALLLGTAVVLGVFCTWCVRRGQDHQDRRVDRHVEPRF